MGRLRIPTFLVLLLLTPGLVHSSSSSLVDVVSGRVQFWPRQEVMRNDGSSSWTLAFRDSPGVDEKAPALLDKVGAPRPSTNNHQHPHLHHQHHRIAADNLHDCLNHQRDERLYQPQYRHKHREAFKKQATLRHNNQHHTAANTNRPLSPQQFGPVGYALRLGLAGGLGGAAGTIALFPMDTAKTLRQANPTRFKSALGALGAALYRDGHWQFSRVYKGVLPSTLGAIPSSALYFGAYESMKRVLTKRMDGDGESAMQSMPRRLCLHSVSAAAGNIISSAVFVPKEAIKNQMQYMGHANVAQAAAKLCQTRGVVGLYTGYKATLLRNIPTAALRFALYEEFKHLYLSKQSDQSRFDPGLFAAGALSGVFASALMTPVDVLKTRIATGTCPVDMSNCAVHVIKESGFKALYAGVGSRMVCSGLFSAIGFGVFEGSKKWLGVSSDKAANINRIQQKEKSDGTFQIYTPRQRRLDHACSDGLRKGDRL